jgi:hypothetical protein
MPVCQQLSALRDYQCFVPHRRQRGCRVMASAVNGPPTRDTSIDILRPSMQRYLRTALPRLHACNQKGLIMVHGRFAPGADIQSPSFAGRLRPRSRATADEGLANWDMAQYEGRKSSSGSLRGGKSGRKSLPNGRQDAERSISVARPIHTSCPGHRSTAEQPRR